LIARSLGGILRENEFSNIHYKPCYGMKSRQKKKERKKKSHEREWGDVDKKWDPNK
jgi:hypothetical protein